MVKIISVAVMQCFKIFYVIIVEDRLQTLITPTG